MGSWCVAQAGLELLFLLPQLPSGGSTSTTFPALMNPISSVFFPVAPQTVPVLMRKGGRKEKQTETDDNITVLTTNKVI